jgi:hypothetical protein
MNNQDIKADAGKPQLTLVPTQILYDIARVREYGVQKYGKSESWKEVEIERYRDATFRHFLAYLDNPEGVDEESGLPHLSHLACNIAFLCELEKERKKSEVYRAFTPISDRIFGTAKDSLYPQIDEEWWKSSECNISLTALNNNKGEKIK